MQGLADPGLLSAGASAGLIPARRGGFGLRRGRAHGTTAAVNGANGTSAASGAGGAVPDQGALDAWRAVRQTADIQYAPVPPPPPPQDPAWLKTLAEALKAFFEPVGRAIGRSWPLIEMLLVALAAVAAAWLAWLLLARLARYRYCSPKAETWAPSQNQALALLEEKYVAVVQLLKMFQIFQREASLKHLVNDNVERQLTGVTVISNLLVPVAVALHSILMNLVFGHPGQFLSQISAVATAHVAPLVGGAFCYLTRRSAQGVDQFGGWSCHKKFDWSASAD